MSAENVKYVSVYNTETNKYELKKQENEFEQEFPVEVKNTSTTEYEPPGDSYWDGELDFDNFRCGSIVFVIATIITIICVSLSFHYIYYDKYALRKNTYSGVDLTKVYGEGRHFFTLDNSLIMFPADFRPVQFNSRIFAENGLEFDCEISFFYRLPKDNIAEIYDKFSTNYHSRVETNAKQVVKNVASTFGVEDFLDNRAIIKDAIAYELNTELMTIVGVDCPTQYVEITNIIFPQTIIHFSLDSAITLQRNEILIKQQEVDIIKADTSRMESEIDAEAVQTIEYSINAAELLVANAEAKAVQIALVTRSTGIKIVMDALNIDNADDKNQVISAFAVMDSDGEFTMLNNIEGNMLNI
jgi:hypothetical protein